MTTANHNHGQAGPDYASQFRQIECRLVRIETRLEEMPTRSEMQKEFGELRSEMQKEFGGLRSEIHKEISNSVKWIVGFIIVANAATVTTLGLAINTMGKGMAAPATSTTYYVYPPAQPGTTSAPPTP